MWTDGCQGKKDYDGRVLGISTQYYPRGGGHFTLDPNGSQKLQGNETRPEIKPSANASFVLRKMCVDDDGVEYPDDGYGDSVDIVSCDFEGETEQDVKSQVEEWVQKVYTDMIDLLKTKYSFNEYDDEEI